MVDIRARREALGVSQFRFARQLGFTSAQLSAWELGKLVPGPGELGLIERRLGELEDLREDGADLTHRRSANGAKGRKKKVPSRTGHATNCCGTTPLHELSDAPKAIALFAGCGGMARGFTDAGFELAGFVELIPEARSTLKRNFPGATCLGHDILDVTDAQMRDWSALGEIDVLVGGPPCQGFSLAGKRDREDPRNLLFLQLLRAARVVQPKYVVMENVSLLLSMEDPGGGLVIDRIMSEMDAAGYCADYFSVNAQNYGVPQFRERIFIVAKRKDYAATAPSFPSPTHGARADSTPSLFDDAHTQPIRTFRDATHDLVPLEAGESAIDDPMHWAVEHPEHVLNWLRAVPEGCSAHDNDDPNMRPTSGYNTTYKRLRWDEPGSTIGTTFGMISASRNVHPQYTRSLTVREAARLQTFPDDFVFEGKWGAVRTMIGNAVPPLLAEHLANHLVKQLPTHHEPRLAGRNIPPAG